MLELRVPELKQIKVLLVEDDLFAQRLTRGVLTQLGIQSLTVVEDGAAAIRMLDDTETRFDLIVSDWNMPNVTGLELLRHVRRTWANMPFLMLTGNANEEFVRTARDNRVDAYVIKPFSPAQLRQKICAILGIRP